MNSDLSYGLNPRTNNPSKASRKRKPLSGFDSDSSNSTSSQTGRALTNKAITLEQNALRKRSQAALQEYDYDGQYESFTKNKKPSIQKNEDKSSKYISKLLQSSQRRAREQEIVYERKVAREQAEEDATGEFEGKEKFVTSAYKRKLAEREEWMKKEKERELKEAKEDVTKKVAGSFLMGGFGRNLLSGGVADEKVEDHTGKNDKAEGGDGHGDSSMDNERWGDASRNRESHENFSKHRYSNSMKNQPEFRSTDAITSEAKSDQPEVEPPKTRKQILEERAVKLREARARYFFRKGLKPSQ